jgi:hypothetical protein
MRPAGSPAKAKETGGFRPAPEGQQKAMPTVILHGRWYEGAPAAADHWLAQTIRCIHTTSGRSKA